MTFNITDPSDLISIDNLTIPINTYSLALDENLAYIACRDDGLYIVDISDPTNLVLVSTYYSNLWIYDIAINGNNAYISALHDGIISIDITNPHNIIELDRVETSGGAFSIKISGNLALVSSYNIGMYIYNITNPFNIMKLDVCYNVNGHSNIAVFGDLVFASYSNSSYTYESAGICVYKVMQPTTFTLLDLYIYYDPSGVEVIGDVAYVLTALGGLVTFDVSNPLNIQILDNITIGGEDSEYSENLVIDGNTAYIANMHSIASINITNPSNLEILDQYINSTTISEYAIDLELSGDYLYVTNNVDGIIILDISDPSNITYISSCNTGQAVGIELKGNILYVAENTYGILSMDVSNPYSPTILDTVPSSNNPKDIEIDGNLAYVIGKNVIEVYDISNPFNLIFISNYTEGLEDYNEIEISGDILFAAKAYEDLIAINISNPWQLSVINSFTHISGARALAIANDIIYVTSYNNGLFAIKIREFILPPKAPVLAPITTPNYNGEIHLQWDFNSLVHNYSIYRLPKWTPFNEYNLVNHAVKVTSGIETNSYYDLSCPDGYWHYAVIAVNENGVSLISNSQDVSVDLSLRAPTLNPITPNLNINGCILLTWNEIPVANNYRVYRYNNWIVDSNLASATLIASEIPSDQTYFIDCERPEGRWYYVVLSENTTDISPLSTCQWVDVDFPAPSAPIVNPILPNQNTNGSVKITWNNDPLVNTYNVYRNNEVPSSNNFGNLVISSYTGTSYTENNVPEGTWYYIVVAINENGTSPISNAVNVMVDIPNSESSISGFDLGFIFWMNLLMISIISLYIRKRLQNQKY